MIKIENLSKSFGAINAVCDLTLHIPKGELFCFLGPNGAGKTTTIKIMTGLLKPTEGSVIIGGIDIQLNPVETKKMLGYIPDMPFLYDRLTAAEFFEFVGDLYGISRENVLDELDKLFTQFGLMEQKGSLIKNLSHGMRQRLIYASTFLHQPEVLFIDEPLIGLDPYTIRLIKDLLISKTRAGMTVFLTTHILSLAESIADRIGIIVDGGLMELGSMEELIEKHAGSKGLEEMFLKLTEPNPCPHD